MSVLTRTLAALSLCLTPLTYALPMHSATLAGHTVQVADGLILEHLATLDGPRLLSLDSAHNLLIGSRANRLYRLAPPYNQAEVLAELDDYPHSAVVRGEQLWVARSAGLYRAAYPPSHLPLQARDFTLVAALPGGGGHNSRSLSLGPDGRLYVALGIRGNCSDEYLGAGYPADLQRGGVLRLRENADGSAQWEVFASGLRNPVGLAWDAQGQLYASNNGPDHWGYEQPPEVIRHLEAGSFHGMPWFQWIDGQIKPDRCITTPAPLAAERVSPPFATLPARSAPMGLAFVPPAGLGPLPAGALVVAAHGSWATQPRGDGAGPANTRRAPMLVLINAQGQSEELLSGLQFADGKRLMRPLGVIFGSDGALYFTSDAGNVQGLLRLRAITSK